MMRQPEAGDPMDGLRASLEWAVPLRAYELIAAWRGRPVAEFRRHLVFLAKRGGLTLGGRGDALQFAGSRWQHTVRAWGDLVDAVAAGAMLAGPEGLTVLGVRFDPVRSPLSAVPAQRGGSGVEAAAGEAA